MRTLRILNLEDSPLDAELIQANLTEGGIYHEVRRVKTRDAFLAALEEERFDLVLSDYSLPSFDGLSALEIARGLRPEMPFILVSGAIGEERAIEALKSGATDYVLKQRLERLVPAIRRAMREVEERAERKRAEEKYRSIFENAVEGIFQTTTDGRVLTANPTMARIFGYDSPEEMISGVSDVARQLYADPEDRTEFTRRLEQEGFVSDFESRGHRKDGTAIWISLNARSVRDDEGNLMGFEGTAEDITERKRTEEAMREVREAERNRMARDLHDGPLQDLTYTLAELEVIRAFPEGTEMDARLGRAIEVLRHAGRGLRSAVYDLRLEPAKQQPFPRIVESLVEQNRAMVPDRDIRLVVDSGFPSAPLGERGTELLRVVQEALTNVRRHSGAGSVRVTLLSEGDDLVAEVADDGGGFVPGTVSGVGLESMRERALALGGELSVESEPGKGTRVRLRIPAADVNGSGSA